MGFIENIEEYISLDDCIHGGLYRVYARNFSLGVYEKEKQGFIGIRHKFKMKFLDLEFHWDTGPPYGTVKPIELLEHSLYYVTPRSNQLFEWLKEKNEHYL